MSIRSIFFAAIMAVTVAFTSAHAALIEIDFDDLSPGTPVTTQYASQGITFSLIGTPTPGPTTFALVDGGTPLNIFGASGNAISPGDDPFDPLFDIELSFSSSIDFLSILALDAEELFTVWGYWDNQLVTSAINSFVGNRNSSPIRGPVRRADLGVIGGSQLFNRVIIDVTGGSFGGTSGGPELFDNLSFNTVGIPEPVPIALIGLGLAVLAFMQRRRASLSLF